jgi:hypothetical protein
MSLLIYELNEIPWKIVDYYASLYPKSALSEILKESNQLTTQTRDVGELHPWSTWPTLHRGVYNTSHGIHFLNQEISDEFPPLWKLLADRGTKVGVFGSLQSYPPKPNDNYVFYVPDTFSPGPETVPPAFRYFQKFNIEQTQRDGAVAKQIAPSVNLVKDLVRLSFTGLTLKTIGQLATHVAKERINPNYRTCRSVLQAPVAFDFFARALKVYRPQFATFFTNHLAGMMHRYWKYTFPSDSSRPLDSKRDRFLSKNVLRALHIADQQISVLKTYCGKKRFNLLIASSMGQEAIDRGEYPGELSIEDFAKFYQGMGFEGFVENRLAMHPDSCFAFQNAADKGRFKDKVQDLVDERGRAIFELAPSKETPLTLNISLKVDRECVESKAIFANGRKHSIEEFGIRTLHRDEGTAYHQPRGVAIFYGPDVRQNRSRHEVELISIAPTILSYFKTKVPSYMAAPLPDVFH